MDELGMEWISVEGGRFMMGGDGNNEGKLPHLVTLGNFYISKYPVTQEQWQALMGNNPSYTPGINYPVECVTWFDVQEFLLRLNILNRTNIYRLPTEAEWEYAARGGNKSKHYKYSGGNILNDVAWFNGNTDRLHEVGLKLPNELGIYDMSGNVGEWCYDWYQEWYDDHWFRSTPVVNPTGAKNGRYRVFRGGSYRTDPIECNIAVRQYDIPTAPNVNRGFRVVKVG